MTLTEARKEFEKLKSFEKAELIFELLQKKELDFTIIVIAYVRHLEHKDNDAQHKEGELAHLLATAWHRMEKNSDNDYARARSRILLEPWLPDEFLDMMVKDVPYPEIEKQIKWLNDNRFPVEQKVIDKIKKLKGME